MKSKINSPKAITLSIGILFAPAITFRLNGTYWNKDQKYSGEYTISKEGKNLILHSSLGTQIVPDHFTLTPENDETANFDLLNVMIQFPLATHGRPKVQRYIENHGRGKTSNSNQHITPRRLSTKRDFFRNECHLIFGTPESPCGHFP